MKELFELYGIAEDVTDITEISKIIESKVIENKLNSEEFLNAIPLDKIPAYNEALKTKLKEGELKALIPLKNSIHSEFGLSKEDVESIKTDYIADPKKYLAEVKNIVLKRTSGSEDIMKLQDLLSQKETEIESIKTDRETTIETLKSEYDGKWNDHLLKGMLSEINRTSFKDKLKVDSIEIFELIYPKLKNTYDFKNVEGTLVPFQKGKDLKVQKDGKVGVFMSIADVLEVEYKRMDIIKESIDPPAPIKVPLGGDKTINNKQLEKALQEDAERESRFRK